MRRDLQRSALGTVTRSAFQKPYEAAPEALGGASYVGRAMGGGRGGGGGGGGGGHAGDRSPTTVAQTSTLYGHV